MIETILLAHPWVAAVFVVATYVLGYAVALYEAHLYYARAQERFVYREGYPLAREYADTLLRGRPASWRFLARLVIVAVALPLVGQLALTRFSRPEFFLAIVGGLVLVEAAESLEHVRNVALFRQALSGASVGGKIEYTRRALLSARYVDLYSLAALFALIALVAGSWFCAGGALGCVVAAQRGRDWVIVKT
jgi:hypothetical protein